MTNEWMNDPSLQEIAPYKLQFLQALIFESASLSREQMSVCTSNKALVAKHGPELMEIAKEKNINFTDQEFQSIVNVLKKHASPEELTKMEKLMSFRK